MMGITMDEFDYIVVGAGSAGCVLAARLSEEGDASVLLIEAGGSNNHWTVNMPGAVGALLSDPKRNWHFQSEPEPELGGRVIDHPRGRMLGGSSSLNGMVYSRGHALDYDNWAFHHGCTGWSYADVLPYFRRAESYEGGGDAYRGDRGPLKVTIPDVSKSVLNTAFVEAGRQAGYAVTKDHNGYRQEGFGVNETTIFGGRRWGSARAYLKPALSRPNLTLRKNCLVERLTFEGRRATGVVYRRSGKSHTVRARREIVLSTGAFGSPQLLMLSGIGPADHLRSLGIDVVLDAPGVGSNLQDHPDLVLQQWCSSPVSLYDLSGGLKKIAVGIDWFLRKSGAAASNQFHAAAFIRTRAGIEHPDIKLELLPIAFNEDLTPIKGHSFQIHITMMRAESRGRIELTSANPADKPQINFQYFSDPRDIETLRNAVRLTRELVRQPALAQYAGEEIQPGAEVQSDEQIDAWIRRTVATAYHPSCSCRMGGNADALAVLSPDLKVRGIDGLRVADTSIMPVVTSCNTNAPTIMIAEKAADMILGRRPLPASNAPYWHNPDWRERQR
jgi:choline dehydrogenase